MKTYSAIHPNLDTGWRWAVTLLPGKNPVQTEWAGVGECYAPEPVLKPVLPLPISEPRTTQPLAWSPYGLPRLPSRYKTPTIMSHKPYKITWALSPRYAACGHTQSHALNACYLRRNAGHSSQCNKAPWAQKSVNLSLKCKLKYVVIFVITYWSYKIKFWQKKRTRVIELETTHAIASSQCRRFWTRTLTLYDTLVG
jgi:hypothetical protein